jgi:hypothetical protein
MTKAAWLEWCERRARLGSPTEVDHLVALIASNPEPREVQGSLQQFTVFGVDDQVRCTVRVVVTEVCLLCAINDFESHADWIKYEDDPCCPFVCDPDWEIQLKVELLADPTGLAPTMASPWIELDRCTNCAQTSVDAPCWVANWDRRDGEVVGYLSRAKTVEIVTALLHEKSRLPNRAGILNWVMYSSVSCCLPVCMPFRLPFIPEYLHILHPQARP